MKIRLSQYIRFINKLKQIHHVIRLTSLKRACKYIGKKVTIGWNFEIGYPENLYINEYVRIGNGVFINANGGVYIGSGCVLGPNVTIFSVNHIYNQPDTIPFGNTNELKPVTIERNCWIGANVFITPGVTIGEGCVIAGGSVVAKSIPPLSLAGGNPAKVIKSIDKELYLERVAKNCYCDWIINS